MTPDTPDPSANGAAAHLAERFAADAQALRRRAEQLDAARPAPASRAGARTGAKGAGRPAAGGPDAAACRRMAEACDRVVALVSGVHGDAELGALIPLLERVHAEERSPDARHVYAGALARLRQVLGEDEDDDGSDDGNDEDDDEP